MQKIEPCGGFIGIRVINFPSCRSLTGARLAGTRVFASSPNRQLACMPAWSLLGVPSCCVACCPYHFMVSCAVSSRHKFDETVVESRLVCVALQRMMRFTPCPRGVNRSRTAYTICCEAVPPRCEGRRQLLTTCSRKCVMYIHDMAARTRTWSPPYTVTIPQLKST